MSIQIQPNAAKKIVKLLQSNELPEGGMRVGVKAGGCSGMSYTFSFEAAPRERDTVVDGSHGAKIFIDPKSLVYLEGTILDYDTSLLSKGFVFKNPQAKTTCGCGISFVAK
jgi:iron-sulfur cluster assembly protein